MFGLWLSIHWKSWEHLKMFLEFSMFIPAQIQEAPVDVCISALGSLRTSHLLPYVWILVFPYEISRISPFCWFFRYVMRKEHVLFLALPCSESLSIRIHVFWLRFWDVEKYCLPYFPSGNIPNCHNCQPRWSGLSESDIVDFVAKYRISCFLSCRVFELKSFNSSSVLKHQKAKLTDLCVLGFSVPQLELYRLLLCVGVTSCLSN